MLFGALPVMSGAHPLFGHNLEIQRDKLGFVGRIAREVDEVSRMEAKGIPAIAVNHPDIIRELLVEKTAAFEKSYLLRFALYPLAGEGLFTSRGDLWRHQRKIMAPIFHTSEIQRYGDDMVRCADRTLDRWQNGSDITLLHETTQIAMGIAGKTLFDADTFSEADELGHALTVALDWANHNSPSGIAIAQLWSRFLFAAGSEKPVGPLRPVLGKIAERLQFPVWYSSELRKSIELLNARVTTMIEERRSQDTPRNDLLSRLLGARADGLAMSDKQVRDEILTLFIAGHETTATGLAWSLYLLLKNRETYKRAQEEADALGHSPSAADVPRLGLLLRVFKEALRLYPPVYIFSRQAMVQTELAGIPIPRLTAVAISPWALHRREDLWPNAEVFDPDRFLPENESKRHRYAWLPFGAGPRICIGNHFAMMEAQLVLARILQRFSFDLLADDEPDAFATLRPKHGVRVRITARA